jgi:hypothetical protein
MRKVKEAKAKVIFNYHPYEIMEDELKYTLDPKESRFTDEYESISYLDLPWDIEEVYNANDNYSSFLKGIEDEGLMDEFESIVSDYVYGDTMLYDITFESETEYLTEELRRIIKEYGDLYVKEDQRGEAEFVYIEESGKEFLNIINSGQGFEYLTITEYQGNIEVSGDRYTHDYTFSPLPLNKSGEWYDDELGLCFMLEGGKNLDSDTYVELTGALVDNKDNRAIVKDVVEKEWELTDIEFENLFSSLISEFDDTLLYQSVNEDKEISDVNFSVGSHSMADEILATAKFMYGED